MHITISELKRLARQNLSGQYRTAIGVFLIPALILSVVMSIFSYAIGEPVVLSQQIITYAVNFLVVLIAEVFSAGTILVHISLARHQPVGISMIYYGFKNHPDRYIVAGLYSLLLSTLASLPSMASVIYFYYFDSSTKGIVLMLIASLLSIMLILFIESNIVLIFYHLIEHPEATVWDAIRASYQHMHGSRVRFIGMILSFLPMLLLTVLSLGLGILWVSPYFSQCNALFYLDVTNQLNPTSNPE